MIKGKGRGEVVGNKEIRMQLKIFFYYINVILAKGQNNIIERVYGQRMGERRD